MNMLVDIIVHLLVPPIIEVGNLIALFLLAWSKPTEIAIALSCSLRPGFPSFMWVVVSVFLPLRAVSPVAAALVETGGWTAEGGALLVQPARGPGSKARGAVAALSSVASPRGPSRAWLRSMKLRVVLRSLLWDRENVVGFADGDKARRGIGVVLVAVRVVFLGQGVELPLDVGWSGRSGQLQRFIVIRYVIGEEWRGCVKRRGLEAPRRRSTLGDARAACQSRAGNWWSEVSQEERWAGWHCPLGWRVRVGGGRRRGGFERRVSPRSVSTRACILERHVFGRPGSSAGMSSRSPRQAIADNQQRGSLAGPHEIVIICPSSRLLSHPLRFCTRNHGGQSRGRRRQLEV